MAISTATWYSRIIQIFLFPYWLLVRLLDEIEAEVSMEAAIALTKFACTDNFLHENHCNAIIEDGGAKHLIQLVYFGEQMVQIPSMTLMLHSITRPKKRYSSTGGSANST